MFGALKTILRRGEDSSAVSRADEEVFLSGLRSVVDLIVPSSWEVDRAFLRLDDVYVRTLALVGYPRYVSALWTFPLVGFAEPLDLSVHLIPIDPAAFIGTLSGQMTKHQSSQILDEREGRLPDPATALAFADTAKLRDALQRGDERVFSVAVYLVVRAPSLPALERLTQSVETTLAGMLAQSRRCTFEHEQGFRSSLPEARDYLGVRRNLDTSSVACAFPFSSATLVHPRGVLYGINLHDRSLVIVDSFHPDLPNANSWSSQGAGWASPSRSSSSCCARWSWGSITS